MEIRRTIPEWITRLELSPGEKFIFVEGPEDQRIMIALGTGSTEVRTVMDVHVDIGEDASPYLAGNRARLVKFAGELALAGALNAKILIDDDMGPFDPSPLAPANCTRTDFACLSGGFIRKAELELALLKALGAEISNDEWRILTAALGSLFAIRKFRYDNYPHATSPRAAEIIRCVQQIAVLDLKGYLRRLKAGGLQETEDELATLVIAIKNELKASDYRVYCYSRDFAEILYKILRCGRKIGSAFRVEHLWTIVLGSLTLSLDDLPRLKHLLEWAQA